MKSAYYVLQPGETHEGVWHVEGMAHDRIVATGIHYLSASASLSPGSLAFRRPLAKAETKIIEGRFKHETPPPFPYKRVCVEVGEVGTPPGSALVFPNSLQHKLGQLRCDAAAKEPGVRKMLCFFLIGAPPPPARSPPARAWLLATLCAAPPCSAEKGSCCQQVCWW